jgi:hypothetical protein
VPDGKGTSRDSSGGSLLLCIASGPTPVSSTRPSPQADALDHSIPSAQSLGRSLATQPPPGPRWTVKAVSGLSVLSVLR